MAEYYAVLRSVVRLQAGLKRCRVRCRHCRIFFLTDPRNAGRQDLGCPFGCRQAHRQAESKGRSTAYYRDEAGREKKRQLNARRRRGPRAEAAAAQTPPPLAPAWLRYLCLLVGLIEGRRVEPAEVRALVERVWRQRRMVQPHRGEQGGVRGHERPP